MRRTEIEEDKAKRDQRMAEREKIKRPEMKVYSITLENVNKPELQLVKNEKADKKAAAAEAKPGDKDKKADAKSASADTSAEDAAVDDGGEPDVKSNGVDPIRNETLNILGDFIELSHAPKATTATAAK